MSKIDDSRMPELNKLKSILNYDRDTGVFRWKIRPSMSVRSGDIAGGVNPQTGYVIIRYKGVGMSAHRLAWIFENESINSDFVVDHINGDKQDNRICNLRNVPIEVNNRNTYKHRNGKIPYIHYHKTNKRFTLSINNVHYGSYTDIDEAINAREKVLNGTFNKIAVGLPRIKRCGGGFVLMKSNGDKTRSYHGYFKTIDDANRRSIDIFGMDAICSMKIK